MKTYPLTESQVLKLMDLVRAEILRTPTDQEHTLNELDSLIGALCCPDLPTELLKKQIHDLKGEIQKHLLRDKLRANKELENEYRHKG